MENNKFKDFLEKVLYPMKIREDKEYIGTGYYKGIQETLDKIIDILKKVMVPLEFGVKMEMRNEIKIA